MATNSKNISQQVFCSIYKGLKTLYKNKSVSEKFIDILEEDGFYMDLKFNSISSYSEESKLFYNMLCDTVGMPLKRVMINELILTVPVAIAYVLSLHSISKEPDGYSLHIELDVSDDKVSVLRTLRECVPYKNSPYSSWRIYGISDLTLTNDLSLAVSELDKVRFFGRAFICHIHDIGNGECNVSFLGDYKDDVIIDTAKVLNPILDVFYSRSIKDIYVLLGADENDSELMINSYAERTYPDGDYCLTIF